jgi:hypothetical protein
MCFPIVPMLLCGSNFLILFVLCPGCTYTKFRTANIITVIVWVSTLQPYKKANNKNKAVRVSKPAGKAAVDAEAEP